MEAEFWRGELADNAWPFTATGNADRRSDHLTLSFTSGATQGNRWSTERNGWSVLSDA
jgi:hypothetical protein